MTLGLNVENMPDNIYYEMTKWLCESSCFWSTIVNCLEAEKVEISRIAKYPWEKYHNSEFHVAQGFGDSN